MAARKLRWIAGVSGATVIALVGALALANDAGAWESPSPPPCACHPSSPPVFKPPNSALPPSPTPAPTVPKLPKTGFAPIG